MCHRGYRPARAIELQGNSLIFGLFTGQVNNGVGSLNEVALFIARNTPEYISGVLHRWKRQHGIDLVFIQLGNPQQNACAERYNLTVRYDRLSQQIFESIEQL